jgi:hypothetical protein
MAPGDALGQRRSFRSGAQQASGIELFDVRTRIMVFRKLKLADRAWALRP